MIWPRHLVGELFMGTLYEDLILGAVQSEVSLQTNDQFLLAPKTDKSPFSG
jgi:hypothetical protein